MTAPTTYTTCSHLTPAWRADVDSLEVLVPDLLAAVARGDVEAIDALYARAEPIAERFTSHAHDDERLTCDQCCVTVLREIAEAMARFVSFDLALDPIAARMVIFELADIVTAAGLPTGALGGVLGFRYGSYVVTLPGQFMYADDFGVARVYDELRYEPEGATLPSCSLVSRDDWVGLCCSEYEVDDAAIVAATEDDVATMADDEERRNRIVEGGYARDRRNSEHISQHDRLHAECFWPTDRYRGSFIDLKARMNAVYDDDHLTPQRAAAKVAGLVIEAAQCVHELRDAALRSSELRCPRRLHRIEAAREVVRVLVLYVGAGLWAVSDAITTVREIARTADLGGEEQEELVAEVRNAPGSWVREVIRAKNELLFASLDPREAMRACPQPVDDPFKTSTRCAHRYTEVEPYDRAVAVCKQCSLAGSAQMLIERASGFTNEDSPIELLEWVATNLLEIREDSTAGPTLVKPVDWSEAFANTTTGVDWLVEPVIPRSAGGSLIAPAKTGKSLFGEWVAACLASGRPVLRRQASDPEPVVYLDMENGIREIVKRLATMGFNEADLKLLHLFEYPSLPPLDTAAGGRSLEELLAPLNPLHVIFDSFQRLTEGEENSNDTARNFYRFTGLRLKKLGIGWTRLDNTGKNLSKGARGGSSKVDDVDYEWTLTKRHGGLRLRRTAARMSGVPEIVDLKELDNPLRFLLVANSYPPGTEEAADLFERLKIPLRASQKDHRAAVDDANERMSNAVMRAAIKFRQARSEDNE